MMMITLGGFVLLALLKLDIARLYPLARQCSLSSRDDSAGFVSFAKPQPLSRICFLFWMQTEDTLRHQG